MYESSREGMSLAHIVLSLSKYWCKLGRMLVAVQGSLCVIGTVRMEGRGGNGTRGRGGGLLFIALEEELDSSSEPELECELHCEHESEHSESENKYNFLVMVVYEYMKKSLEFWFNSKSDAR